MNLTQKAILFSLTNISGIGDARAYELYKHFDDPWRLSDFQTELTDVYHYVDQNTVKELQSLDTKIDENIEHFENYEANGINIIGIEEKLYPEAVRAHPAPALLYAKGNTKLLNKKSIGVSGSRETNEIGQQWIKSLSAELTDTGYTIVSGGARGADTAAHRGTVDAAGSTIVVLGTGVNVAYPPENESLFERIIDNNGLLISMRAPDAEPTPHAFIDRNELIAALSDGIVFVATNGDGGTMAQHEIAQEQNIAIFTPPEELNIEPSDGLTTIREADGTTEVQTTSDFLSTFTTENFEQKSLDEW
jgi:DNA processing protein